MRRVQAGPWPCQAGRSPMRHGGRAAHFLAPHLCGYSTLSLPTMTRTDPLVCRTAHPVRRYRHERCAAPGARDAGSMLLLSVLTCARLLALTDRRAGPPCLQQSRDSSDGAGGNQAPRQRVLPEVRQPKPLTIKHRLACLSPPRQPELTS